MEQPHALSGRESAGPLTSHPAGTRALLAPCPALAMLNQMSLPPRKILASRKRQPPAGKEKEGNTEPLLAFVWAGKVQG